MDEGYNFDDKGKVSVKPKAKGPKRRTKTKNFRELALKGTAIPNADTPQVAGEDYDMPLPEALYSKLNLVGDRDPSTGKPVEQYDRAKEIGTTYETAADDPNASWHAKLAAHMDAASSRHDNPGMYIPHGFKPSDKNMGHMARTQIAMAIPNPIASGMALGAENAYIEGDTEAGAMIPRMMMGGGMGQLGATVLGGLAGAAKGAYNWLRAPLANVGDDVANVTGAVPREPMTPDGLGVIPREMMDKGGALTVAQRPAREALTRVGQGSMTPTQLMPPPNQTTQAMAQPFQMPRGGLRATTQPGTTQPMQPLDELTELTNPPLQPPTQVMPRRDLTELMPARAPGGTDMFPPNMQTVQPTGNMSGMMERMGIPQNVQRIQGMDNMSGLVSRLGARPTPPNMQRLGGTENMSGMMERMVPPKGMQQVEFPGIEAPPQAAMRPPMTTPYKSSNQGVYRSTEIQGSPEAGYGYQGQKGPVDGFNNYGEALQHAGRSGFDVADDMAAMSGTHMTPPVQPSALTNPGAEMSAVNFPPFGQASTRINPMQPNQLPGFNPMPPTMAQQPVQPPQQGKLDEFMNYHFNHLPDDVRMMYMMSLMGGAGMGGMLGYEAFNGMQAPDFIEEPIVEPEGVPLPPPRAIPRY